MNKIKEISAKLQQSFKNNVLPKLKTLLEKDITKKVLKILGIMLAIAVLIFGSVKLYSFSKTAYLRPYVEKYKIEYPEGILEEMCDAYGKDQSILGRLEIEDMNYTTNISSIIQNDAAFFENGTKVDEEQHFRSVRVNRKDVDLEELYSNRRSFLNSSQSVKLTTLFSKEEYRVVAAFYTNTNPEDDNGYVFPYDFCGNMNEKDFKAFEDRIIHRTIYNTGYEFSPEDYFLSLSAPSDFMEDFRFVVVCVKTGKRGFDKSKTATPNEKIHYPQVWYDKNHQDNPYIFAGKWYPKGYK